MSADNLAKDLAQFERMTRAVITVGEEVKGGLIKKQNLENLEKSIAQKQAEMADIEKAKEALEQGVIDRTAATKDIIKKAEEQAAAIVTEAKEKAAVLVLGGKEKAATLNKNIQGLTGEVAELEGAKKALIRGIADEEKKINTLKDQLRKLVA